MLDSLPYWQNFSLKQQIGQLVVVRASGYLFDHQIRYPAWEANKAKLKRWLEELNLGGVILLGGSAAELWLKTQQLQSWARTPLLVAADIEEGVGQRFTGATWFPPPMALGKIAQQNLQQAQDYAFQMGAITAQEAQTVGINWLLAPIVDVNNNPANPVINIRAFGDTPEIVTSLARAFIQGAQQHPILTTAKHFPGHGDTITDSHLDLPSLSHSEARLAEIELPPFQEAIAVGVDSVMTAHLLIPAWDQEYPATLSKIILTDKLRQELKFDGLIVTDALIMGGMTKYASPSEIAVRAIEAGADVLLMPDNPEEAIAAIYQAIQSGRLTPERIHESLRRIWKAKEKVIQSSSANSFWQLSPSESIKTTKSILGDSLEIGGNLPVKFDSNSPLRNLVVVDDLLKANFLNIQNPTITIPQQLGYELQLVDQNTLPFILSDSRFTLLQIFIRGNPFRGTAGLTAQAQGIYQQLLEKKQIQGLIIYGSPYVLDWFTAKMPPQLPWVFAYGQMSEAQAIALAVLFGLKNGKSDSTDLDFGF